MDLTKFTCGNAESFLPEGNVQVKLTEISTLINVRESRMHMRFKDSGVFQVLWLFDGKFILPTANEVIVFAVENQKRS